MALGAVVIVVALGAGLAAALAGFGHRFGWWHFTTGFMILRWAAIVALGTAGAGLVAAAWLAWRRRWGLAALTVVPCLAVAVAAVGVPWSYMTRLDEVPVIHDVSTDTEDPPRFQGLAVEIDDPVPGPYPGGETARLQRRAYPDVRPLVVDASYGEAYEAAAETAHAMGWEPVRELSEEGRIEAVATTFWFGFKDDIAIRVRPAEDGGAVRIDVRSVSRVGQSDLGANAERVRTYLKKLRERL